MLPTFAKEAMDSVSGSIYDTLMHNPKFAEGQKMSREEFIE
jgi:hypothetical protein